jgi:hypothetical protein
MDIDGDKPRQLALTVGKTGSGSIGSLASSPINSSRIASILMVSTLGEHLHHHE